MTYLDALAIEDELRQASAAAPLFRAATADIAITADHAIYIATVVATGEVIARGDLDGVAAVTLAHFRTPPPLAD